jgi:hypothetical protein
MRTKKSQVLESKDKWVFRRQQFHGGTEIGVLEKPRTYSLRMGELYDFVQHNVYAEDERPRWFRVLWGKPKAPLLNDEFHRVRQRVFQHFQINLLVEMVHFDDAVYEITGKYLTVSKKAFHDEFLCSEDVPENLNTGADEPDEYEGPYDVLIAPQGDFSVNERLVRPRDFKRFVPDVPACNLEDIESGVIQLLGMTGFPTGGPFSYLDSA